MKIAIISPMTLPIPAEQGGAIETIIDQIFKANVLQNNIYIDCYSVPHSKKIEYLEVDNFNKIIYIDSSSVQKISQFIYDLFYKVLCKLGIRLPYSNHIYKNILKKAKSQNYDYIIFEGGSYESAKYFVPFFGKEKLIMHIHHTMISNRYDDLFDKVICVSDFVKEKFLSSSTINSNKVYVLKNIIDSKKFTPALSLEEKVELRKSLGIKKNEKVILFCGRIIKEKGIEELIRAFKRVNEDSVRLLIIGSHSFGKKSRTKFERRIQKMIQSDRRIIKLGFVENNTLYKYYKISDLFVMPSMWEEAAGLVNLEAAVAGIPIITTNVGGIPEYINLNNSYLINKSENFETDLAYMMHKFLVDDINYSVKDHQMMIDNNSVDLFLNNFVDILKK